MTQKMNPEVSELFDKAKSWKAEMQALRALVLESELVEEVKWYQPCYTYEGRSVIIIGKFKDCCTISFFKGALIPDPEHILEMPGPNTRAARVIKFDHMDKILRLTPYIRKFIQEAVAIEKEGKKYDFREGDDTLQYPEEWAAMTAKFPALQAAFDALTPGRKRAYLLHFNSAKQPSTRSSRIEKCLPKILEGKGKVE